MEINYGEVFGVDTGANESAPAQRVLTRSVGSDSGERESLVHSAVRPSGSDQDPIREKKDEARRRACADDGTKASEKTADAADQPESRTKKLGTQPSEAGAARRGGDAERKELSRGEGKRRREAHDDDNAKYAAARRKAERERDAAVAQARAAAQRALDESIRNLGLENPYTGRPITTKAEYDAWKRAEAQERAYRAQNAPGGNAARRQEPSENGYGARVPQRTAEAAERQRQAYRRAAEAASRQEQRAVLESQLGQIARLDPSVKCVEDLMRRPEYPKIYGYVRKGLSIPDAFRLANYDALTRTAAAGAKQAAINAANSKEHLAPTGQRGAGAVPVPADVKAQYRLLNPDATESEIREHYNRYHKT